MLDATAVPVPALDSAASEDRTMQHSIVACTQCNVLKQSRRLWKCIQMNSRHTGVLFADVQPCYMLLGELVAELGPGYNWHTCDTDYHCLVVVNVC